MAPQRFSQWSQVNQRRHRLDIQGSCNFQLLASAIQRNIALRRGNPRSKSRIMKLLTIDILNFWSHHMMKNLKKIHVEIHFTMYDTKENTIKRKRYLVEAMWQYT